MEASTDTAWVRETGVEVVDVDGRYVCFRTADEAVANQILAQALQRGTVTRFQPVVRNLHEIYKEMSK